MRTKAVLFDVFSYIIHERKWKGKFERKRDSFGILYTGYLLSIVKIKTEIEKEREERERKTVKVRDRERKRATNNK